MHVAPSSDSSYVSMSRLEVDAERSEELITAFRNRAGLVEGAAGFRGLQVWRSERDCTEVVMVSFWESRAAFRDYMRSEDHQTSHDRITPELQSAIQLQRLEHLSTYDIVAR